MPEGDLRYWTALWVVGAIATCIVRLRRGKPSAGLVLVWVASLFMINGLPGLVFSTPGDPTPDARLLAAGMEVATHAIWAAFAGVVLVELLVVRGSQVERAVENPEVEHRLGWDFLLVGIGAYAASLLMPSIPTLGAVLSAAFWLIPIGLFLLIRGTRGKGAAAAVPWLLLAAATPALTTATAGFLGYGAVLTASALFMLFASAERRARAIPLVLLGTYLGLSLFVTYMRDRDRIRGVVWGGERWTTRLETIAAMVTDFELFEAKRPEHRERVDARLNQVTIVGLARENLELGLLEFGHGETIRDAVIAVVPRILWPEKPVTAGSGGIVTRYTGVEFASGTSVGATQVLEAYANFGFAGVWCVFGVFGFALGLADWQAGRARLKNDYWGFVTWFLPAAAITNAGGSFVELTASAASGLVLARILHRFFGGDSRKEEAGSPFSGTNRGADARSVATRDSGGITPWVSGGVRK